MAKLLIFRGESLLDERELTEQTLRIGRAPQNEIVLEDPGKGVSREHAEIRFEGGRYALFDRDSQNGIWVSGTRVPFVVLDPGVSAAVGPFRLMVEVPVPVPPPPVPIPDPSSVDTAAREIESTVLSQPEVAPLVLDDLAPRPEKKAAPPPPPPRPPAAKVPPKPQGKPSYADPRVLAIAGAVLLIAVSAVVAYKFTRGKGAAEPSPIEQASLLVKNGGCPEALQKHINPALAQNPNDEQWKALRDQCLPPPTTVQSTTSVPAPVPVADRLNEAEALLTAKDCQKALDVINAVLLEDQSNERAKDLFAKTNACLNPSPAQTVTTEKPVVVPAAQGGLTRLPNESNQAYRDRNAAMRKKYEDAVALLQDKKYQQAKRAFDEILQNVPTGYLDLAQRREEAIGAMRAEAKNALEAAQAADGRDDFDVALREYRRAHDLDPTIQVDGPTQRVNDRKTALGKDKCAKGKLEFSFGNNAGAIPLLQDAVKLLPQNDPCAAEARQILQRFVK